MNCIREDNLYYYRWITSQMTLFILPIGQMCLGWSKKGKYNNKVLFFGLFFRKHKDFMFLLQLVLSLYWPLHIYSMLPHPSLPGYGKVFRSNLHLHLVVGSDHFHTTIKLGKRSMPKGENKRDLNWLNTTGVKTSQPILNQSCHPYSVPCWLHLQYPGAVSIFYVQFISGSQPLAVTWCVTLQTRQAEAFAVDWEL